MREDTNYLNVRLAHEQLRREVLRYMIDYDDDPIELLSNFAERLRVLINCDQVIYRDLEETRIMVNSPAIEKTWAVPIEYCMQCEHFDAHHPMYDGGYTEVGSCQEGWQGIPVYHDCPIKSSLTRIVYCDGEVAGYLAIHYVTEYHNFTDIERTTLEEFAHIISISLSRFKAKKENTELKRMGEMEIKLKEDMQIIGGLAGEYRALFYISMDEGTFKIYSFDKEYFPNARELFDGSVQGPAILQKYGMSEYVHPEDRCQFAGITNETIRERLAHSKKYTVRYRRKYGEEYLWSEMDIIKYEGVDERANVIAMGFAERDLEIRGEEALNRCFAVLGKDETPAEAIQELLELTGEFYGADHVGIFEYTEARDSLNNTFEWSRTGLKPVADNLQNIPASRVVEWINTNLHSGIAFMAAPILNHDEIVGYIALDNPSKGRKNGDVLKNVAVVTYSELLKRKKAEESQRLIDRFVKDYEASVIVNINKDEFQLLSNSNTVKKMFGGETSYSKSFGKISELVYEADKERVHNTLMLSNIIAGFENTNEYSIRYRGLYKKHIIWYEMRLSKLNDEEFILAFKDVDDTVAMEMAQSCVSGDCYGIYLADLETDTLKIVRRDENYGVETKEAFGSYTKGMLSNVEKLAEKYQLQWLPMCSIEGTREFLRSQDKRELVFESPFRGNTITRCIWYVIDRIDGEARTICLAFTDLDEEQADKEKLNKQIAQQLEMISGLASEYTALYHVNLDNGSYVNYSVSDRIPETKISMQKYKVFGDHFRDILGSELVLPEDRKILNGTFPSDKAVKKLLVRKKSLSTLFRRKYGDDFLWTQMNIVKCEDIDEEAHSVMVGFIEKDREVREEKERQRQIQTFADTFLYSYVSAYYVNLQDYSLTVFHRSKYLENTYGHLTNYLESVNRYLEESCHPDDREAMYEAVKPEYIRERLRNSMSFTVYMRDISQEDVRWFRVDFIRGFDENHAGIAFRDVTDKLAADKANADRLEKALAEAEVASKSKTTFLFNMSHDIRTPMNAITGFTSMAKKYVDDREKVLEYLDKIDISGHQLLQLINQVLEMARIESGKIEFESTPVNIKDKFNSMVTVLSEQAQTSGRNFNYSLENIKHYEVYADDARMASITLNIAGNAIKYTPEGGTIDFTLKEIKARKRGYATYTLSVSDNGIGMSEEYLTELFEPFSRENSSTVSKIQGTGLGLSIVKSLVDLMDGTIEVTSQPGCGTRFDITLDFKIDKDEVHEDDEEANADRKVGKVSFEGHRILLAEDNEMNREIAKNLLEEQGFIVEEAEDGDIAVEKVRTAIERKNYTYYNIILMDVQMPRMNGYEATKAIRALHVPKKIHIPIIAMTANAFEEDRRDALAAGMDDHLAKPIEVKQLFDTLARFQ